MEVACFRGVAWRRNVEQGSRPLHAPAYPLLLCLLLGSQTGFEVAGYLGLASVHLVVVQSTLWTQARSRSEVIGVVVVRGGGGFVKCSVNTHRRNMRSDRLSEISRPVVDSRGRDLILKIIGLLGSQTGRGKLGSEEVVEVGTEGVAYPLGILGR